MNPPNDFEKEANEIVCWMMNFDDESCFDDDDIGIRDKIATAIRTAVAQAVEDAARIAKEYGSTVNKDKWSITHTMAGERIAEAIRKGQGRYE